MSVAVVSFSFRDFEFNEDIVDTGKASEIGAALKDEYKFLGESDRDSEGVGECEREGESDIEGDGDSEGAPALDFLGAPGHGPGAVLGDDSTETGSIISIFVIVRYVLITDNNMHVHHKFKSILF